MNVESPELIILSINACVLFVAYFFIFPYAAGNNLQKLLFNDAMASLISISVAGFLYFWSGLDFDLFLAKVNWFWFSLITYALCETPLMLWYLKKNNLMSRAS